MKYILLLIVTIASLIQYTKASQFSDLELCESSDMLLKSRFYSLCPGAKEISAQIYESNLSVKEFYNLLIKATDDIDILEKKINDDLIGTLHSLLFIEKKFEYHTTSSESVVIIVKKGMYIFEKLDTSWRLKVILFD
jgi:hypothetical protein